MNIVVLDGYALNPGDLNWEALQGLGKVTVYERTPVEQIVERALAAEIVLTNKTPISKEVLAQLPKLRYIGVLATGYNIIDTAAAKAQGVVVANIPDYGTFSVAQHTIALLLELCNQVQVHAEAVRQGEWVQSPDWCFTKTPLTELYGKKLGIIGHGSIGQQVGRIAVMLGMQVLTVKRNRSPSDALYGESYVALDELFAQADVVSLHCPLTTETKEIINQANISQMKRTALFINTSRGGLVAEQDLADALNAGKLAGAGLDVLSLEPPKADQPLLTAAHCLVTPHIAWATKEARTRMLDMCVENIRAFQQNRPLHLV